jgi:hypothetical protein
MSRRCWEPPRIWPSTDNVILDLPLAKGKLFGDSERVARHDAMYCWSVDDVSHRTLKGVAGVDATKLRVTYSLIFRTNPDHQIVSFTPGIGITGFVYSHHGTVSEVNVRLIRFAAPR